MQSYLPAVLSRSREETVEYAFSLLDVAANRAIVPVSHFYVGAVAVDDVGNLYLGANSECRHAAMAHTLHAEQSAVAHAWLRDATCITDIIVNHTPCGYCRQFLNELRGAQELRIHLPHSRQHTLKEFLPESFGPQDLSMSERFLDLQQHNLTVNTFHPLVPAALDAANRSYAPYSRAFAGVALQTADGAVYPGRYAENAAYNPSLPPLQCALNLLRLDGKSPADVEEAVLVCTRHGGHAAHTRALWEVLSRKPLHIEYL